MNEELLNYVLKEYPHTNGNNTEICIALWEEVAKRRGINLNDWSSMKSIIRSYKPEAITRKRRATVKSTVFQREEETRYHEEYGN